MWALAGFELGRLRFVVSHPSRERSRKEGARRFLERPNDGDFLESLMPDNEERL
jgi:hypothetical protein